MVSSQVKTSRIFTSGFDHESKTLPQPQIQNNENIGITIMNVVVHIGTMYATHLSVHKELILHKIKGNLVT